MISNYQSNQVNSQIPKVSFPYQENSESNTAKKTFQKTDCFLQLQVLLKLIQKLIAQLLKNFSTGGGPSPGAVGMPDSTTNSPGAQSAPSAQGSDVGGGIVGTNSPGAQSASPQNCNTTRN